MNVAPTYNELLHQVQQLDLADQLRLIEDLATFVRQQIAVPPQRSITELKGLGKEIWQGIDAQEYVNEERKSWNR
jgi:hypothetical protein